MDKDSRPYAEIGKMLRDARKDMRMDVRQAADALHIRAIYIEALEEGRFDQLPGVAYAKGYLQSYAMLLQLDRGQILGQFERIEASLKRGFYLPDVLSREKKPASWAMWGGIGTVVVIYGLWLLIGHSASNPLAVIDAPPEEVVVKAEFFHNPACFTHKAVLYPPCYGSKVALELPKKRKIKSVLDLAQQN
jgi:cytoskeleton protein RodZ